MKGELMVAQWQRTSLSSKTMQLVQVHYLGLNTYKYVFIYAYYCILSIWFFVKLYIVQSIVWPLILNWVFYCLCKTLSLKVPFPLLVTRIEWIPAMSAAQNMVVREKRPRNNPPSILCSATLRKPHEDRILKEMLLTNVVCSGPEMWVLKSEKDLSIQV